VLTRRVIACLDVDAGRVVKGTRFRTLRDQGDPVALAARYEEQGVDEIVFLDVTATVEGRATALRMVERAAGCLTVPLTLGGGIRTADDVASALRAGADKVAINAAILARPALLGEAAARFGAQCMVASIDARRHAGGWEVVVHGGRTPTGVDALAWAVRCSHEGAGEILLTSIDRDGVRGGYDLALVAAVAARVAVPVVASGGAGAAAHLADAVAAGADAVLVAGMLHDGSTTVAALKCTLAHAGVPVRRTA
jgi:cyclase